MSAADKPDPAESWMYVEKLLALDEADRLHKMSDAELDEELRAKGDDPSKDSSAEELLARIDARVKRLQGRQAETPAVPIRPKVTRIWARPAWVVAAAFLLVLIGLAGAGAVAYFHHRQQVPIGPDKDWAPRPPPTEVAGKLRDEAFSACDDNLWALCRDKLDEAQKLDPAGETEERVQKARQRIEWGLDPDRKPRPDKPGGR